MRAFAAAFAAAAAAANGVAADVFTPTIVEPAAPVVVRQYADDGNISATLYSVAAAGYTDGPFYIANITAADHFNAGYAYARLLANESVANFASLFHHEFPKGGWTELLMDNFLDFQYDKYTGPALPQEYQDEMAGVDAGGRDAGVRDLGALVRRGLALASIAVGDVEKDLFYLIEGELDPKQAFAGAPDLAAKHAAGLQAVRAALRDAGVSSAEAAKAVADAAVLRLGKTCSFWGAWGSRTTDGQLFSGRNLDWAPQTGVSKYKTITVMHIGDTIPNAAISFAGLTGAITGMSAAGITVHEAGDDNKLVTLEGFAWSLRLRAVMEQAHNLAEARALWEATNNTMGINHGIGSAADPGFLALETRAGYTAYFEANDTREAAANVDGVHYGFPMPEAVWRTNHPYDPKFIETMVGAPKTHGDSQTRYMLLHDTFKLYEDTGVALTPLQAVNLTALVGDKGGTDVPSFITCGKAAEAGENIVTASFEPAKQTMYVAFEDGLGSTPHVPGCCNNYVHLDMAPYFAWTPPPTKE